MPGKKLFWYNPSSPSSTSSSNSKRSLIKTTLTHRNHNNDHNTNINIKTKINDDKQRPLFTQVRERKIKSKPKSVTDWGFNPFDPTSASALASASNASTTTATPTTTTTASANNKRSKAPTWSVSPKSAMTDDDNIFILEQKQTLTQTHRRPQQELTNSQQQQQKQQQRQQQRQEKYAAFLASKEQSNIDHRNGNSNNNNSNSNSDTPVPQTALAKSKRAMSIPGVTKMTMRQTISIIFTAFWERADLYTDVLELDHDKPSPRQLRLAFFRQGRKVLATPIESPDDMTTVSAGMRPMALLGSNSLTSSNRATGGASPGTAHLVQSGVKVSRKAKLKFQAINLAYDLLNDEAKKCLYDEWRVWNSRLPPPSSSTFKMGRDQAPVLQHDHSIPNNTNINSNNMRPSRSQQQQQQQQQSPSQSPSQPHHDTNSRISNKASINTTKPPSILRESKYGKKKKKRLFKSSSSSSSVSSASTCDQSNNSNLSTGSNNNTYLRQNRKLTWNEEVEELVIMECSREEDDEEEDDEGCKAVPSPSCITDPYDPFSSFDDSVKENIEPDDETNHFGFDQTHSQHMQDPYTSSFPKDNWFGTNHDTTEITTSPSSSSSLQQSRYEQENNQNEIFLGRTATTTKKTQIDSLHIPQNSRSSSSSPSSSTLAHKTMPIQSPKTTTSNLDDSLLEILDEHKPRQSNDNQRRKQHSWANKVGVEFKEKQIATLQKSAAAAATTTPRSYQNDKENTIVTHGDKTRVKINVRTCPRDTPRSSSPQTAVDLFQSQSHHHQQQEEIQLHFTVLEETTDHQYEDVDEFSVDTRSTKDTFESSSWKAFPHSNDCGTFPSSSDCGTFTSNNDFATFDFAKGFQVSLSNYINAAVTEMKQGWDSLGKKWEENKPNENPLLLQSFEIDAMMDILKTEMNTLSPANNASPFNADCGALDGQTYVSDCHGGYSS